MKKFKFLLIIIFLFLLNINNVVAAGSASISVNNSTIENGSSVKASVTVKNVAAWNVTITSSGVTNGCTKKFADATSDGANATKTFTVTCKSNSTGIINFVMSGDITSSDGTNTKISGSKSVKVVTPREKSTNNSLKSLSVDGYEISPKFDKDVNEYTVSVPHTVEKIKINAKKADSYASLDGTGEKTVNEGANTFEIVVTSETGASNVYKLTVNVMDQNPVTVPIDGKNYTLVKVAKNLEKPDLFEETTIKIGEYDIPAFYNEYSDMTLVGLKDEVGNIELFIYDKGEYKTYNVYLTDKLNIIFLEMDKVPTNYVKTSYTINEEKTTLYKLKGEDKLLLYGMNLANGKKNYYTFDKEEKTLQVFDIEKYENSIEESNNNKYIIFGLGIVIVFLIIIIILLMVKSRKLKKLLKLKSDKK
ncbi:MAG: cadherin-like beta sandwich domain-containing protein [Bacilli bacterium]|nr:cadherin-like beta sandwich domain-containing protein [Bacilli bacterium]